MKYHIQEQPKKKSIMRKLSELIPSHITRKRTSIDLHLNTQQFCDAVQDYRRGTNPILKNEKAYNAKQKIIHGLFLKRAQQIRSNQHQPFHIMGKNRKVKTIISNGKQQDLPKEVDIGGIHRVAKRNLFTTHYKKSDMRHFKRSSQYSSQTLKKEPSSPPIMILSQPQIKIDQQQIREVAGIKIEENLPSQQQSMKKSQPVPVQKLGEVPSHQIITIKQQQIIQVLSQHQQDVPVKKQKRQSQQNLQKKQEPNTAKKAQLPKPSSFIKPEKADQIPQSNPFLANTSKNPLSLNDLIKNSSNNLNSDIFKSQQQAIPTNSITNNFSPSNAPLNQIFQLSNNQGQGIVQNRINPSINQSRSLISQPTTQIFPSVFGATPNFQNTTSNYQNTTNNFHNMNLLSQNNQFPQSYPNNMNTQSIINNQPLPSQSYINQTQSQPHHQSFSFLQNNNFCMDESQKNKCVALFSAPKPQQSNSLFGTNDTKKNTNSRTNRKGKNKGPARIY